MPSDAPLARLPLLLLAAGRSSRLGAPKALRVVDGEPFLAWQLRRFRAAGGCRAVVALGAAARAHAAALPSVPGLAVRAVVNPAPEGGPFSSLLTALAALRLDATSPAPLGAFVLPVDVPVPAEEVWALLADALDAGIGAAVPVACGRGGHPVLLSWLLLARLATVPLTAPDARLDRQLAALPPEALARVPVNDANVALNLNTEEDWRAWELSRRRPDGR